MSFQRYPLSTVQKVSQFLRETLTLPDYEQNPVVAPVDEADDDLVPENLNALGDLFRVGDMPEDNVPAPNKEGRWFVSTVDPSEALSKLPGLWIRSGIRLVTYLKQDNNGGVGYTVALPDRLSSTEQLESAIEKAEQANQLPQPMGTLENIMESIEGDGSLSSFLSASIFAREIREFGRFGGYARWTQHRFVTEPPPKVPWQWRAKTPEDFSPKVVLRPNAEVIVEFYSCRVQKPIALLRHVDRYPPNSYIAASQDQVVAVVNAAPKQ
jgi:hypothetical protein